MWLSFDTTTSQAGTCISYRLRAGWRGMVDAVEEDTQVPHTFTASFWPSPAEPSWAGDPYRTLPR